MVKTTIALISIVLMMLLVERTVCFTAVDASWGKRSEKVIGKDMCEKARRVCNMVRRAEKQDKQVELPHKSQTIF